MKDNNSNNNDNKNMLKNNNEKQNIRDISNNQIKGNKNTDKSKTTISKNKTVDKSKNVDKNKIIDKSKSVNKSKNIIHNNNINKMYYIYKQNIDNNKKKIQRPGLFNREIGSIIKFKAILVGKYTKFSNCVTIINLHRGKEYLADHTQLMLNETLEELNKRNTIKSCLIQGTGKISQYKRKNGEIDYCIELLPDKELYLEDDIYYNPCKTLDEINDHFDIKEFYDKLMTYEYNDLLYLISKLRRIINELTTEFLPEDFLYHYIINQYSLNSLNVDLYKDELQNNTFTEEELYEINILLGNLIFYLRDTRHETLFTLFRLMTICLNSVQGIISLHKDKNVNKKINKHFAKICKNKNISFGKAMMIVLNRSKNFNIKNYVYADNAPYNEVLENGLIGIYYADK